MRHLAGRCQFDDKAGAALLLHFLGERPHGFLRDDAALPARKGGSGIIERQEEFRALALAFLPQCKGFLHRSLFVVQPAALNGSAGECLLIRSELYVHRLKGRKSERRCQVGMYCDARQLPCPASNLDFLCSSVAICFFRRFNSRLMFDSSVFVLRSAR